MNAMVSGSETVQTNPCSYAIARVSRKIPKSLAISQREWFTRLSGPSELADAIMYTYMERGLRML
jgi:hypothetical protein